MSAWSPESWRQRPAAQQITYDDPDRLDAALGIVRGLPPIVTPWEVDRLRALVADAQEGRRFLLQGGDCAETLADCRPDVITNKLKILLQMSLVLVNGLKKPVIRVGRFAGQYAKPRSSPTERRGAAELPSYFGDLVNRPEFTPDARRADPALLVAGYEHAAITMNYVRSLAAGGFADLEHPEYWDLSFFEKADLPSELGDEYRHAIRQVSEALRFMQVLGETSVAELSRVEFYASHEGLHLPYESSQLARAPHNDLWYVLTTHLPWIGERTRDLGGAHVELFRGVANPVGVKLGPTAEASEVVRLCELLDPGATPGKLVLVTRMGAARVADTLPPIVEAVTRARRRVLWVCDPMHGNTTTSTGPGALKTRDFDQMLEEIERTFDVHEALGTTLGGVHFELTGEDVTECTGGAGRITEADLDRNYATLCDPRLNYRQSLEMAFRISQRAARGTGARGA